MVRERVRMFGAIASIACSAVAPRTDAAVVLAPRSCAAECRAREAHDGVWTVSTPTPSLLRCYQACAGSRVVDIARCADAPVPGDCTPIPPTPKSETWGVAVGGGIGYQTPIIGVQLTAYLTFIPPFTVAPWIGGGAVPDVGPFSNGGVYWARAFGAMLMFGYAHRFVIDVASAPARFNSWERCDASGCSSGREISYRFASAVGYEYMSARGFYVRPLVGYIVEGGPAFQLSLGGKLW